MTSNQAKTRIARLRRLIAKYNYQYHMLNDPTITDADYDQLFAELKNIEAMYPKLVTLSSPTQRVGFSICGSE